MDIESIKTHFFSDCFATKILGAQIEDVRSGYARCSFTIEPKHLNAVGTRDGRRHLHVGRFCVCCSQQRGSTSHVSLSSQISFLGVAKGTKLIAEARCEKQGRSTCTYLIHLFDDLDTPSPLSLSPVLSNLKSSKKSRCKLCNGLFFIPLPSQNCPLPTPHNGQTQSSGMSSKAVPGSIPLSGSPCSGSYTYPQTTQTYLSICFSFPGLLPNFYHDFILSNQMTRIILPSHHCFHAANRSCLLSILAQPLCI